MKRSFENTHSVSLHCKLNCICVLRRVASFTAESILSVAALASAHGAALLALTKQCITAVSDAATPPASVATLLECALLCVRAVFKLRARLTCPPLSLEAFLRRILVDAYTKRLVRNVIYPFPSRRPVTLHLSICIQD